MDLKNDLFIIESERYEYIIYSPLGGALFAGNKDAVEIVRKYIAGQSLNDVERNTTVYRYLQVIEQRQTKCKNSSNIGDNLTIILTQKCNLACSYCYAHNQRSEECLDIQKLKLSIDYYVLNSDKIKKKRVVFIGGGEPTLAWSMLTWAIEYIDNIYDEFEISCSLITNGTLLSSDRLNFLKEHNVKVVFSFDILPNIQNRQRSMPNGKSSFEAVDINIRKAADIGVDISGIRSTITESNVELMMDMVKYVSIHYPYIKSLNLEPVTSHNNTKSFYDTYLNHFCLAMDLGKQCGINVYNSISISFKTIKERFCQREFCVTPTGDITSCHRISSYKDKLFGDFIIGKVYDVVSVDDTRINALFKLKQQLPQCSYCFCKYHCAGGCVSERLQLTSEQKDLKCALTRGIILKLLENQIKDY